MRFGFMGVGVVGPWYVMEAHGKVKKERGVDCIWGWERTREKDGKGGSRCIGKERDE
jgi:hypothetical protein